MRSPGDCSVLHRGYRDRVRIATWNVNSLRSRIDRVEALLDRHEIDVLALQETKAREDQLPLMGLQARGYDVAAAGTNQWNGLAIISRVGVEDVETGFPGRAAFQAFLDDGYVDVVRPHAPGPGAYTYWDYYRQRYERNRGMRIDFVLGSPGLAKRVTGAFIDKDERAGKGASDHAPVIVDLV